MADLKELLIQADTDEGYEKLGAPGITIKILWENGETGFSIALFKVEKGAGVPERHTHASNQFMYCLRGRYRYTDSNILLTPGDFYSNPKDHPHGPTVAEEDSLLLEIYDGAHYYETPGYAVHE